MVVLLNWKKVTRVWGPVAVALALAAVIVVSVKFGGPGLAVVVVVETAIAKVIDFLKRALK